MISLVTFNKYLKTQRILPDSYYEANINQILKPDKNNTRKV